MMADTWRMFTWEAPQSLREGLLASIHRSLERPEIRADARTGHLY